MKNITIENCRLFYGDCVEIMSTLDPVDMVLTDPPYGTTRCKWDSVVPFDDMWRGLRQVSNNNTPVVMTACQPFSSALVMSNPKEFRYDWIWEKPNATGFLNAKKMPMRAHESILVFYKKLPTYNPQMTSGHERKVTARTGVSTECYGSAHGTHMYDSTDRYPRSVQVVSSDKQKTRKLHPTAKPVALMEYLIRTYTNKGDTVLDFTMGSGTTGVACVNTGRKFIGIELEREYFDIAVDRISTAQANSEPLRA